MRVYFYGLAFETPRVTVHLWSPWRASALEHRLFEAVSTLPRIHREEGPDEWRVHVTDPKTWRVALQALPPLLQGRQGGARPRRRTRERRRATPGRTHR